MEWTWLFVFIGLMYVMHRFGLGCCGNHNHAGHDGAVDGKNSETKPLESSRKEKEEFIRTEVITGDDIEKRV